MLRGCFYAKEGCVQTLLLQQVGEVIENGIKELEAAAEEAGPEEDQEGPDPEMAKDMEKHRQKLAQAQEEFEMRQRHEAEAFEQKKAIKDLEAASQLSRSRRLEAAKTK